MILKAYIDVFLLEFLYFETHISFLNLCFINYILYFLLSMKKKNTESLVCRFCQVFTGFIFYSAEFYPPISFGGFEFISNARAHTHTSPSGLHVCAPLFRRILLFGVAKRVVSFSYLCDMSTLVEFDRSRRIL